MPVGQRLFWHPAMTANSCCMKVLGCKTKESCQLDDTCDKYQLGKKVGVSASFDCDEVTIGVEAGYAGCCLGCQGCLVMQEGELRGENAEHFNPRSWFPALPLDRQT
jgi:hypothetical protein